jgi:hypothetical protein
MWGGRGGDKKEHGFKTFFFYTVLFSLHSLTINKTTKTEVVNNISNPTAWVLLFILFHVHCIVCLNNS